MKIQKSKFKKFKKNRSIVFILIIILFISTTFGVSITNLMNTKSSFDIKKDVILINEIKTNMICNKINCTKQQEENISINSKINIIKNNKTGVIKISS